MARLSSSKAGAREKLMLRAMGPKSIGCGDDGASTGGIVGEKK